MRGTMTDTVAERVNSGETIEKPTFLTRKAEEVVRLLQYQGCQEYVDIVLRPDRLLTLVQRKLHLLLVGMEAPTGEIAMETWDWTEAESWHF